jgi:NADH-quinone oxidoreductase subunit J
MITRAPTGLDEGLDADKKVLPALLAVGVFLLMAWSSIDGFGTSVIESVGTPTTTELIGESLLGRFVIPFEVVSIVLLAALIGSITIARRDLTPAEEEERAAV